MIENINDNCTFFEKKDKVVTYDELEKQLCDKEHRMLDKDKFLADYLISVWLHGNKEDKFYDSFEEYIMHGNQRCISGMLIELSKYEFDKFWIERSLSTAEYQLHELGYFEEKNKFRNISLMDLIMKGAADGSYNVVTLAASYLKLANYEKREVDINNLAYSWIMYFEHKDYSVYAIDEALFVFEKQKLIREEESFAMIQRLMAQSDDGISHLLTSYVNKKGVQYVRKVNGTGYFKERSCRIRFWELAPEIYDCFDRKDMDWQITELLRDHYQSKFIEWRYIQNVMESKYKNMVLDGIEYYEYSVLSPNNKIIPLLDSRGIKYIGTDEEDKVEEYVPLHYGCIHEEDFEYISEKGIGYLEIAQYADGWYSCLPFVDVFLIYNKADIQRDYLEIVHRGMYARAAEKEYYGNWNLLLGNIPAFLSQYEIDVDWKRIYKVFTDFLDMSLIWHIKN